MLLDEVHENFHHFQSFQKVRFARKIGKYMLKKLRHVTKFGCIGQLLYSIE